MHCLVVNCVSRSKGVLLRVGGPQGCKVWGIWTLPVSLLQSQKIRGNLCVVCTLTLIYKDPEGSGIGSRPSNSAPQRNSASSHNTLPLTLQQGRYYFLHWGLSRALRAELTDPAWLQLHTDEHFNSTCLQGLRFQRSFFFEAHNLGSLTGKATSEIP